MCRVAAPTGFGYVNSAAEVTGDGHDTAMTTDRVERKFLLPRREIRELVSLLDQHLTRHRFTGEGANRLPNARHYATTVYFDLSLIHI